MLLLGFLCCVTALLGELSALPVNDQVVQCSETKVKVHEQCRSEAGLCQAVENFTLALTCAPCGDNDTVTWLFSPASESEHVHQLSQQNKTLFLAAVNVTKERASGCYQCWCRSNDGYFSVQVEPPVPPTFLVKTVEDTSPTDFDFIPSKRDVPLKATSPGVVCINCSATGYPNVQYRWTYKEFAGDWKNASSNPCMMFSDNQPEVLCFTPTVENVLQLLTYQCEVSNIVQTVTARQEILYPNFAEGSEWFVRPHQLQSREEIPLTNGTATAICAAYQQTELVQFEYYVCALLDTANASLSACLFNSLNCCSCRDDSCSLGINVTQDRFVDSLGIPTYGCRVDSAVEGNFACVIEKTDVSYLAKQFIGNFSFVSGMSASPPNTPSDVVLLAVSASGGAVVGVLLVLVPCCLVMVCCCVRCLKVARARQANWGDRRHLLSSSIEDVQVETPPDQTAAPTPTLECAQTETPSQPRPPVTPSQPRPPVTSSQPRPLVTPSQPRPLVTPSLPRPLVTPSQPRPPVTPAQELFDGIRKQQCGLIDGLHLDGRLLALLNEREVLTKKELNDINAHIMGHNIAAAGTHFINAVMFQWPLGVFECKVRSLIEALLSHDDSGNHKLASNLSKSFSECGLDVPRVKDSPTMH